MSILINLLCILVFLLVIFIIKKTIYCINARKALLSKITSWKKLAYEE
ncbi:hypothetical protein NC653_011324 [Populus alba x Populus x berolinensis]|uniref:Uncharacterized protein n=1 Tax=Populus alba x Populus x berolinensis TaxID=444605 RepID=A0AAD6W677_9ROSI|nr:hypothetical protein NC653_011324 [Populus alba x Populus x berolinensis]